MRILVLVTGQTIPAIAARRGDYPRWIRETCAAGAAASPAGPSLTWTNHDVRDATARLPGPLDADAFVITGSSSSVTERAPWMLRTEALVRDVVAAKRPVLGICFGHQLMATALGGEVTRNPLGREMGAMRVERVADDDLFAGLPRAFDIHGTHVDAVSRLPPGAELLASTPKDAHAAFRVGDRAWGVQFHPEFDADVMRGYLHARADVLRSEGSNVETMLARVDGASARGVEILGNFVRVAAR